MAIERIDLVYAAPIPVGHRVRVTWYVLKSAGMFGGAKTEERRFEPVVVDLDTGIEYATDFVAGASGAKYPNQPIDAVDGVRSAAAVHRTIEGRVTRCRVLTVRGFSEMDVQTLLTVETSAP